MTEEPKFTVEEVDAVDAPRKARVQDVIDVGGNSAAAPETPQPERQRDYLEGFLSQAPSEQKAGEPGGEIYEGIIEVLKEIFDPEIPVNIYDLGLIYGVDVTDDGHAVVTMTLTTPNCPVAESMPGEVELRVGSVPGVGVAEVVLVWDPPWNPQLMSDEAKLELGML